VLQRGGYTIRRLHQVFERAGHRLEIVAVDNGSRDRTGAIIADLAQQGLGVVPCRVERNEGFGHGVLTGLPLASANLVGIIPADGQVDAEDVVRLFEAALSADGKVIAKVRRRFRMDGLLRKVVSVSYNLFTRLLWPTLASIDLNGNPKIFPRAVIPLLRLESKGWLLDLEFLIKTHYLGLRVLEFNVFARMRGNGTSHVRASTCWEFFKHLLAYRFSRRLARWKSEVAECRAQSGLFAEAPVAPRQTAATADPATV
jgi:glycosyltransferase involved in cell wall biosynthesis